MTNPLRKLLSRTYDKNNSEESEINTNQTKQTDNQTRRLTKQWSISKRFDFCYGHRVWSQRLQPDYCSEGDATTKCRHLHGHQGELIVHITKYGPLDNGFVTDFKHLGWVKDFIDTYLDHKFIIDINDPWFANITNLKPFTDPDTNKLAGFSPLTCFNTTNAGVLEVKQVTFPGTDKFAGYIPNYQILGGIEREYYESFFLVPFIPTSERLAQWLAEGINERMSQLDVFVDKVEFCETPKSRAVYSVMS